MHDNGSLAERLRGFAAERDWEQFHTPKNLAMALAGEVGELLAELQWLTPEESAAVMADAEAAARIRAELGDVAIYLTRLADVLGVDLMRAAHDKLDASGRRYDAATYRGSARKAPPITG
ncbi:nucleotide pyrophosphohydrolase [Actinomadura sp. 3N407]|uniref:nucleotide pyrophosphohydrolase n=1 Tax=Actinomadura sp. 3N407 TaxID=3457423 RepID=UPI003FCED3B0